MGQHRCVLVTGVVVGGERGHCRHRHRHTLVMVSVRCMPALCDVADDEGLCPPCRVHVVLKH